MREGARDYLTKPFVMSEFLTRLEHVLGPAEPEGDPVLGVSAAMREVERFLRRAARGHLQPAADGRDWRRQGGVRPLSARAEGEAGRPVHGGELRGDAGRSHGERAARPREGRVHRRARAAPGLRRARRAGRAVPGRGRRAGAEAAGQAVAADREPVVPTRRRRAADPVQGTAHLRDQRRSCCPRPRTARSGRTSTTGSMCYR